MQRASSNHTLLPIAHYNSALATRSSSSSPSLRWLKASFSTLRPGLTRPDELRLVQTSLLGSVLSNLLLVLGMSFFA